MEVIVVRLWLPTLDVTSSRVAEMIRRAENKVLWRSPKIATSLSQRWKYKKFLMPYGMRETVRLASAELHT
jgi:hypothetical protein